MAERLWRHLQEVTSREKLEYLCAQYTQQDPRKESRGSTALPMIAGPNVCIAASSKPVDNSVVPNVSKPSVPAVDSLDGLAAQEDPPVKEEVVTGNPTDETVTNVAASSLSAASVTQAEAPVSATAPPAASGEQSKLQKGAWKDSLSDSVHFGELKCWSGVEGEVWF